MEIRKQLIQTGAVDVMIAVGSNFFYTVTLPCMLWFLDKGKARIGGETAAQFKLPMGRETGGARRSDTVLFVDARRVYTQVDRAHREFTPAQIEFIANVVRLYRGHEVETDQGSAGMMAERFPDGAYRDVAGLCKVATIEDIEAQSWSLNPGRYVGVPEREEDDDFDFAERLMELHEELEILNTEAHELEGRIAENVSSLLG
jgi:type I restriction enzyme M protein